MIHIPTGDELATGTGELRWESRELRIRQRAESADEDLS